MLSGWKASFGFTVTFPLRYSCHPKYFYILQPLFLLLFYSLFFLIYIYIITSPGFLCVLLYIFPPYSLPTILPCSSGEQGEKKAM